MSSTVNQDIITLVTQTDYGFFSSSVGIIVLILLLALLIVKDMLRTASDSKPVKSWHAFNVAVFPLFVACGVIIIMRDLYLIIH